MLVNYPLYFRFLDLRVKSGLVDLEFTKDVAELGPWDRLGTAKWERRRFVVLPHSFDQVNVLAFAEWEELVQFSPDDFHMVELILKLIDADPSSIHNFKHLLQTLISLQDQFFIISAKGIIAVPKLSSIDFIDMVGLFWTKDMLWDDEIDLF